VFSWKKEQISIETSTEIPAENDNNKNVCFPKFSIFHEKI